VPGDAGDERKKEGNIMEEKVARNQKKEFSADECRMGGWQKSGGTGGMEQIHFTEEKTGDPPGGSTETQTLGQKGGK